MRFSVLSSGSTGNAIYVESESHAFLIDAGMSARKLDGLLASIDRSAREISGILVTHEHSDHIKGLGVTARKYKLPIYANAETWQAMEGSIGDIPSEQRFHFDMEAVRDFGSLSIESFAVSHDAANPMFYVFHENGRKLAVITDTGYVSDRMKGIVCGADAFVFESNHDVGMLQMSSYPWNTKRRILSDIGHVSNEDAALAMSDCLGDRPASIYLAHLSRENNMKDLARMSVVQTLAQCGVDAGGDVRIFDTDAHTPTALADV